LEDVTVCAGNKVLKEVFIFLLLFGQLSFPEMVMPIELASIHLPLEDVTVRAGRKVLMEVDKIAR
jgi:hypothetical protein